MNAKSTVTHAAKMSGTARSGTDTMRQAAASGGAVCPAGDFGVLVSTKSFPQGGYIEGHFSHDELDGDGTWVYSNGIAYSGHFVGTMKEGNGRLLLDNGDEYIGQFHKDLRNGYGVQRYINGNRFDGMWLDDTQEGPGKYTWANGQIYDGQMHNGR